MSYLRIDTSNPPGNETAGARFLQQLLIKDGIDAKLVGSDPKRQSVYARLASGSNEKALVLLHHIDVVPAVASEWTKPPFAGVRSNGYIWGRGALDIKSLGIAELMAFVDLKRRHVPLRRDVIYLAVADEELGGINGCARDSRTASRALRERRLRAQRRRLQRDHRRSRFVLGHRGAGEGAALAAHHDEGSGRATPPSPPDDGGTLAKLVRSLDAISRIPTPYRLTPAVARAFHEAGKARRDERGEVLRGIARAARRRAYRARALARLSRAAARHDRHHAHRRRQLRSTSCRRLRRPTSTSVCCPTRRPTPMVAKVKETLPAAASCRCCWPGSRCRRVRATRSCFACSRRR